MLNQWLTSRTPQAPEHLAKRLDEAVRNRPVSASENPSTSFTAIAVAILDELASGDSVAVPGRAVSHSQESTKPEHPARATALDLLAADALITYAVEAAAEDCEAFAAKVDAMIDRLSRIVPTEAPINAIGTPDGPSGGE